MQATILRNGLFKNAYCFLFLLRHICFSWQERLLTYDRHLGSVDPPVNKDTAAAAVGEDGCKQSPLTRGRPDLAMLFCFTPYALDLDIIQHPSESSHVSLCSLCSVVTASMGGLATCINNIGPPVDSLDMVNVPVMNSMARDSMPSSEWEIFYLSEASECPEYDGIEVLLADIALLCLPSAFSSLEMGECVWHLAF